jgi:carbamoyl-phosphate synthase small subunit
LSKPAILVLQDGSVFRGISIGADGITSGEVVFNTAMTGYQEILTDPSYCRQVVTLTYPHIGNVGMTDEDEEARDIWAAGLIIRDLSMIPSNFRSQESLSDYLKRRNVVGIADIDTRRLTRILREKGAQNGCIMAGDGIDADKALEAGQGLSGPEGHGSGQGGVHRRRIHGPKAVGGSARATSRRLKPAKFNVVAYDFGVKRNILRMLVDRGCKVTVVPAQTPAPTVLALKPDGIFLSNGPGDPEPCDYAIDRHPRVPGRPTFRCSASASATSCWRWPPAPNLKMKFGHHGANHPVQNLETGR